MQHSLWQEFTLNLSFLTAACLVFVSPFCGCADMFLLPLNREGVYAWIGINFVLGRFDHADEGECEGVTLTRRI